MARSIIIYARWSSQEQGSGTTLQRQIDAGTAYAEARGWVVTDIVTDEGVSAYTGANITAGNLARLVEDFACGVRDPNGAVIIVEELDRLSRAKANVMFEWLFRNLNLGLTFVTANKDRRINRDTLNDLGTFFSLVAEHFGSHSESAKKADRLAEYWRITRKSENLHPNIRHPAWLENRGGELVVREGAQETIDLMFSLALMGYGATTIAKTLNQSAIVPWAVTKNAATRWTPTRIKRVIFNDATLGYYTPYNRPRMGAAKRAGEKIRRYPAVVDVETFAKVNERKSEKRPRRSIANLIPRVSRCYHCDGAMGARGSSKKGHYYVYCQTAKSGTGECDHQKGWRYADIERPLLDMLLDRALNDQFFAQTTDAVAPLAKRVTALRVEVAQKGEHLEWLFTQETKFGDLPMLASARDKVADQYRAARDHLVEAEQELERLRGRVSPEEHRERVRSMRSALSSEDEETRYEARKIARDALGDLIERIEFDADADNVVVHLVGGIGTFLILDGEGSMIYNDAGVDAYREHPRFNTIKSFIERKPAPDKLRSLWEQ